ncbi:MAG TPA: ABC transporter permease subunit [Verrucomicrobiae bacterium]|jgi:hypothetical protein
MILPIVERELRVAGRRKSTYLGRGGAALLGMIFCGWSALTPDVWNSPSAAVGARIFNLLFWFIAGYIFFSALKMASQSLSAERREGTLGFLFLTDLKGFDVVLGKLAATSLNTLYGTLAVVPILGIPILMGGVTAQDFIRAALALLNLLFYTLSLGMFTSSFSVDEKRAFNNAFLIVLVFDVLLAILGEAVLQSTRHQSLGAALAWSSPFATCYYAFQTTNSSAISRFFISLTITVTISVLLLLIASRLVSRSWQERPVPRWRTEWRDFKSRWIWGNGVARLALRRELLPRNAILWLCSRQLHQRIYPWVFLFSMFVLVVGLFWNERRFPPESLSLFYFMHLIFKLWVGSVATQTFPGNEARASLELLLSTSLPVPDILQGHWQSIKRLFAKPLLVLLAFEVLLLVVERLRWPGPDPTFSKCLLFMLGNAIVLVMDCYALSWVGLWRAMNSKNPQAAFSSTVVRVLSLPIFLLFGGSLACLPFAEFALQILVLAWVIFSLAVDIIFSISARARLPRDLRRIAVEGSGKPLLPSEAIQLGLT